ncbi:heterokaryon incompatibility protein HET-C [Amylocystis lapponica]|nr:heterokaryon incompatibility protein HET-C [Amylocystis lapponica]
MAVQVSLLLLCLCVLVFCVPRHGVYAFGAGNIPSFAYMEGRAFRHGDIEDALSELAKRAGGGFALGALIGKGGSKFSGLDIKRVYFGNWLRDYSQAVDVAGLQKLQLQTIINLCMVLGFMAHGYATAEFEVTPERLGVYLPTEHIDNPKGYPDNAQSIHPQLRGPVDPRELEIDSQTGMKNYISNENGHWDTSKALVRRTLQHCIQIGRQSRASGVKADEYEAYRLLGQALHTLEDFSAHSNFCELSLVALGHRNVFVHVGDQVRIQARDGQHVAPLVTGTFGSSDFIHSLLGEATDHISQASVTDLNAELEKARAKSGPGGGSGADGLRELLFALPGGNNSEMVREVNNVERIRAGPNAPGGGGKRPEDMSPQELHSVLWQVLTFRDSVMKKISNTIENIPGLGPLIEKLSDSISVFVFTTLEPFLKPIMKQATAGLQSASGEVIDKHDQYEVFDSPHASDPTHSFLSKDHFNLILNEPAGHLGKIILAHTVKLVVKAWDDSSVNAHHVTEDILQCMFHPNFHERNSAIQREMMEYMARWVRDLGPRQNDVLARLTKNAVRNHQNVRHAGEGGIAAAQGTLAQQEGLEARHDMQQYLTTHVPGAASAQSFLGKIGGASGNAGAGGSPIPALGQTLLGAVGASSGSRRDMPPGTQPQHGGYPGAPAHSQYGAYAGAAPVAEPGASSYYSASHTVSMPNETRVQTSSYTSSVSPTRPFSGHGHGHGHEYAPPPGPPPGFPQSEPGPRGGYTSTYAPSYSPGYGGGGAAYGAQEPYAGGAPAGYAPSYGSYAAPPISPPGGLGFPSADVPPPGGFPLPGPYGAALPGGAPPPHHEEHHHHQPHHHHQHEHHDRR